jgi:hypothetical protein
LQEQTAHIRKINKLSMHMNDANERETECAHLFSTSCTACCTVASSSWIDFELSAACVVAEKWMRKLVPTGGSSVVSFLAGRFVTGGTETMVVVCPLSSVKVLSAYPRLMLPGAWKAYLQ